MTRQAIKAGSEFQQRLIYGLIHDCYEFQANNTDYLRLGIHYDVAS